MPLYRTLRYKVKAESVDKCRNLLQEYVALVKQHEPGTLFYVVVQEQVDPTIFMHWGIYRDTAAQEDHNNTPYLKQYADQVFAETPVQGTPVDYDPVATNLTIKLKMSNSSDQLKQLPPAELG